MTKENKERIRSQRGDLVDNMIPEGLLTPLQTKGVLDQRDVDKIQTENTEDGKNEKILDIIKRKPNSAYLKFIDALNETGQSHVAGLLEIAGLSNIGQRLKETWPYFAHVLIIMYTYFLLYLLKNIFIFITGATSIWIIKYNLIMIFMFYLLTNLLVGISFSSMMCKQQYMKVCLK